MVSSSTGWDQMTCVFEVVRLFGVEVRGHRARYGVCYVGHRDMC
jgi:hypothetical protein